MNEKVIYNEIANRLYGNETKAVLTNSHNEIKWLKEDLPTEDEIAGIIYTNYMLETLKKLLASEDSLSGSDPEADDILRCLYKKCKEKDIVKLWVNNSKDNDKTEESKKKNSSSDPCYIELQNWIVYDVRPSLESREHIYQLCFALELGEKESSELFFKGYMYQPFNFKNYRECVFYFCLKNKKTYEEALNIIKEIDPPEPQYQYSFDNTSVLTEAIKGAKNKEALIKMISEHYDYINTSPQTVLKEIMIILDELLKTRSQAQLLRNIYYTILNLQGQETIANGFDSGTKCNNLREFNSVVAFSHNRENKLGLLYVTDHWPTENMISRIKKAYDSTVVNKRDNSLNPTALRKTLIMMSFYHFFSNIKTVDRDDYYRFFVELSVTLEKCGMVGLYPRNPYDWLFLKSAASDNPLETFKRLLNKILGLDRYL